MQTSPSRQKGVSYRRCLFVCSSPPPLRLRTLSPLLPVQDYPSHPCPEIFSIPLEELQRKSFLPTAAQKICLHALRPAADRTKRPLGMHTIPRNASGPSELEHERPALLLSISSRLPARAEGAATCSRCWRLRCHPSHFLNAHHGARRAGPPSSRSRAPIFLCRRLPLLHGRLPAASELQVPETRDNGGEHSRKLGTKLIQVRTHPRLYICKTIAVPSLSGPRSLSAPSVSEPSRSPPPRANHCAQPHSASLQLPHHAASVSRTACTRRSERSTS